MEVLVSQYHPGQSSTLFSPKKKYNEAASVDFKSSVKRRLPTGAG